MPLLLARLKPMLARCCATMLERFALLLAAALSVAGVDGACWDYGEDECQYDEEGSLCEWVDSWDSCQNACSVFNEDWECDGS